MVCKARVTGMLHRSPPTGFGKMIIGAGYYKQATPNGVIGQPATESENKCMVQDKLRALQTLREIRLRPHSTLRSFAWGAVSRGLRPKRVKSAHPWRRSRFKNPSISRPSRLGIADAQTQSKRGRHRATGAAGGTAKVIRTWKGKGL